MEVDTSVKKIVAFILSACIVFSLASFAVSAEESPKDTFIETIESINASQKLTDRMNYLSVAEMALDEYVAAGGSVTDADIAEHYALYEQYLEDCDAEIAIHEEFMSEVNLAYQTQNDSYPIFKEHMNRAEELLPTLDNAYPGISGSVTQYNNLVFEFEELEEFCTLYIEYATLAKSATTYAEASKYVKDAERVYTNVRIFDFPGIEEADEMVTEAKTFMGSCEFNAAPFLAAVTDLHKSANLPLAIKEAYELLETIDETTVGVDVALSTLRSEERKYNRAVEEANAILDGVGALSLMLIF